MKVRRIFRADLGAARQLQQRCVSAALDLELSSSCIRASAITVGSIRYTTKGSAAISCGKIGRRPASWWGCYWRTSPAWSLIWRRRQTLRRTPAAGRVSRPRYGVPRMRSTRSPPSRISLAGIRRALARWRLRRDANLCQDEWPLSGIVTLTTRRRSSSGSDRSAHTLCGALGTRLLVPDSKFVGPDCSVGTGGKTMAAGMEVIVDECVS